MIQGNPPTWGKHLPPKVWAPLRSWHNYYLFTHEGVAYARQAWDGLFWPLRTSLDEVIHHEFSYYAGVLCLSEQTLQEKMYDTFLPPITVSYICGLQGNALPTGRALVRRHLHAWASEFVEVTTRWSATDGPLERDFYFHLRDTKQLYAEYNTEWSKKPHPTSFNFQRKTYLE